MRWNTGGPDLPAKLFQKAEEGTLVLFCGAGISYPAGLPGYRGLVDRIYEVCGQAKTDLEQQEYEQHNYDRTLGLLESRICEKGSATANFVRDALIEILQLRADLNLQVYRSLIEIATSRGGRCRLVTTNFDQGFFLSKPPLLDIHCAPRLPVPKVSTWHSIVHLHGLISDADRLGLDLVVTSADFGAAYLTEGWASRFVTEMFRSFIVLFIGYSIEDPVIRYMMDAFAADRRQGRNLETAYALVGANTNDWTVEAKRWEAKGVTPVLYDSADNHSALYTSLNRWAETHRTGLQGKESVLAEAARYRPESSNDSDVRVSQVLWALDDATGHLARYFVSQNPPLEWFDVFKDRGLLEVSVVGLGTTKVPLVSHNLRHEHIRLHPVTLNLGQWLADNLEDKKVLDWVISAGGHLHPDFRRAVRERLSAANLLEPARQVWRLLLFPDILYENHNWAHLDLITQLEVGEWSYFIKQQLIAFLRPRYKVTPAVFTDLADPTVDIASVATIDVILTADDGVDAIAHALKASANRQDILRDICDDVTILLRDAIHLFRQLNRANETSDPSYADMPSITPHAQNHGFHSWTELIELARECYLQLKNDSIGAGQSLVSAWKRQPFPIFQRLCLYAMNDTAVYDAEQSLEYLLGAQGGFLLWSTYVHHETWQLLEALWPVLSAPSKERLSTAILSGPPREMFRADLENDEFQSLRDISVWRRLMLLHEVDPSLPQAARERLEALTSEHPGWQFEMDRDGFVVWIEAGPGRYEFQEVSDLRSINDAEILQRLREPDGVQLTEWQGLVATDVDRGLSILDRASAYDIWPAQFWKAAAETIFVPEPELAVAFRLIGMLLRAPETLIREIHGNISWGLLRVAKSVSGTDEDRLWQLWDRVARFAFPNNSEFDPDDAVFAALNRPSGYLGQCLIERILARNPAVRNDVPDSLWDRLTVILSGEEIGFQLARVYIASRIGLLYVTNRELIERLFIPKFRWETSEESPFVWQGFLWTSALPPELWPAIKPEFLNGLRRAETLGRLKDQIFRLYGLILTHRPDWIEVDETRDLLRQISTEARAGISDTFWRTLEAAGERGERLWEERLKSLVRDIWPKDRELIELGPASDFALLAIVAGNKFPEAVEIVSPFLRGTNQHLIIHKLKQTRHAEKFPRATVTLLEKTLSDDPWVADDLGELLDRARAADATLAEDAAFRRISEFVRRIIR